MYKMEKIIYQNTKAVAVQQLSNVVEIVGFYPEGLGTHISRVTPNSNEKQNIDEASDCNDKCNVAAQTVTV